MNPGSRLQIGRLLEARGWIPERRTKKKGQPVIDDELLESLPSIYPDFSGLAEHDLLRRRLAQLAHGKQAWLKHIADDGRIHGGLVPIGTPHSRAKHLSPNLAQVPNAKKGGVYAAECRALFQAPAGWAFVTCDQANLQDRGYAHYLHTFDGGAYAKAFLSGDDQHWQSAVTLGLVPEDTSRDKQNKTHEAIREGAKRFRYAFLYGCGAKTAGRIISDAVRAVQQIDSTSDLQQRFFGGLTYASETALKRIGRRALDKFEAGTPGLQKLRESLQAHARQHGWLPGLDGRRVPVRGLYSALNFIVTSSEAIICKRWLVRVHDELCTRFRYGWAGDVVITLWIHDEIACCCRPEIAEQVGEIMVRHAKEPGEFYSFKVPFDANYKIGRNLAAEPLEATARGLTANSEQPDEADTCDNLFPTNPIQPTPAQPTRSATMVVNGAVILATPQITDDRKICCPFHADKTPSCQLYADGHYHCFGCGAHGWIDEDMDDLPDDALARVANVKDNTQTLERGLKLWNEANPIANTLAARYLAETRKLDLTVLPTSIDEVLRFHPRCPFGGNGARHPCLLALFRDVELDTPAGIHRIGLTPEGAKIAMQMPRRTFGCWPNSRAIKLWSATTTLVIGEGVETVLGAIRRGVVSSPAWAMGSRTNIAKLPVLPGIATLTILVDNDANAPADAETCAARWTAAGRSVRALSTKHVKDFNDLVMA